MGNMLLLNRSGTKFSKVRLLFTTLRLQISIHIMLERALFLYTILVVEMVQLLLDYGADKSIETSDGKTAYDYPVQSNNNDVISLLEK